MRSIACPGEVAFFGGGLRTAKVWAIKDSKLLRLNFEDYEKFAAANVLRSSELLFALARLVARRLRDTMSRRMAWPRFSGARLSDRLSFIGMMVAVDGSQHALA